MQQTVLVTGGAGFIGSHVVDQLAAAGYRPRIFDLRPSKWHDSGEVETVIGDIRDIGALERALDGCDAVCHLAAAADVGQVIEDPAGSTELNGGGTLNVLEAARRAGVRRVVYASTVWVYSDVEAETVDEQTLLPHPAHIYTAGKLAGELYCRSYAELYDIEPTIVRFGIPYGPRARPAAVIPSFVDRARRGEALTIAGDGGQVRAFVYVEDLAGGVVRALDPAAVGKTYNLAGSETTIRELAEIVRDEVAPVEIIRTEARAGDLRGAEVDSSLAAGELGWTASTPLREGVRAYAQWVVDDENAAAAPAPVAAATQAGGQQPRRVGGRRGPLANPAVAAIVALAAVLSAGFTVVLSTDDRDAMITLAALTVAFALPLWTLITTAWPRDRWGSQRLLAAVVGVCGVLLLALASDQIGGESLHPGRLALVLLASGLASVGLRTAASRLGGEEIPATGA